MIIPSLSLYWAALAYIGALVALAAPGAPSRCLLLAFLGAGFVINSLVVAERYLQAWPMLPMHLAPVLTPCILAFLLMLRCCLRPLPEKIERRVWQLGLTAMAVCLLAAQIFPKNFYLPFLRSESPFAHVMLLAGAGGRACFLASMAWGVVFFAPAATEERGLCLRHSLRWAIWGFALWTLAMFSGEMWAYLGWGTPVIWHDPAILLMMAVWFLYIAFLHLHFSKLWGQHSRAAFAAVGGCTAVVLSLLADFGPFRPFW